MANRWLFAGGDYGTFRKFGNVIAAGGPNPFTNFFNPTYSDHRVTVGDNAGIAWADFTKADGSADTVVVGETLWVRAGIANTSPGAVGTMMEVVSADDTPRVALRTTGNSSFLCLSYWDGTVWNQIGQSFFVTQSGNCNYFDIMITLGNPHTVKCFADNMEVASGTYTDLTFTEASAIKFPFVFNSFPSISEVMATVGIVTVNGHVFTSRPNAAGTYSDWTGSYTDVNETFTNDANMISTVSDGQRSTFNYANLPDLGTNYVIGDVFMNTRVRIDGVSPSTVRPVRRTNGTDNVGSPLTVGFGFNETINRYTGLTKDDFDNSEFGVDSTP